MVPTLLTSFDGKAPTPSAIQVTQSSETTTTASGTFRAGMRAFEANDYELAIASWQTALEKFRAEGDQDNIAVTLNALAAANLSLGRYGEAIAYSRDSADLARSLNHLSLEAQALGNLGIAYQASGRYANAVETYEQALTLLESTEDSAAIAQLHGLLGNAYQALGDYFSAITAQETSLEIAATVDSPSLEATAQMNLGGLYSEQGDYSAAIAWYEQGIALAQDFGFLGSAAYGLNNLGGTYQQLGQSEAAIVHFQESFALAQQTGNRALQATVLTNLGVAYEDTEAFEQAMESHQASVAIARTVEDPRLLADALNNLAHTQLLVGELTDAEIALKESIQLLSSLREGLTDEDKVTVFDTQIYTYNLLMQVQVAQGNYEAALETSEQGRARAFVEVVAEEDVALSPPSIDQIKQTARELDATIIEYAIVPKDDFTVQGRQRGETGEIFVWVVAPSGQTTFKRLSLDQANFTLEEQVQQSRTAIGALGRARGLGVVLGDNADTAFSTAEQFQAIYAQLIAPIEDALPSDPDDLVVLIPHESLFYLPFAALQDADGRYLIERHTLLTAPAIQLLDLTLEDKDLPSTASSLVVGNPEMPLISNLPTLQPLPGAESEAQEIARLFQTEAIIGSAATESAVADKMETAGVIHLATHGLLDYIDTQQRIPIPGAIALTPSGTDDGLLTASEIADLSLIAQLVVLSACDTGLGEVTGDGVVGLSRSLIAAGAKSTVVSLWSVPDEPTSILMQTFYKELQEGHNKAEALRQAMLQTKEIYPNPLAWAAFVLVGNPAPLQDTPLSL
ncbi:CHAT domain-containing tetratricopeptide repeat protein [Oscillatoria sp. CS-180]|nr:CHAT domain-containing tetratricopeptide repeat protein [Oscillatoria sp. CS-180]